MTSILRQLLLWYETMYRNSKVISSDFRNQPNALSSLMIEISKHHVGVNIDVYRWRDKNNDDGDII
jgi:hypothetical protein